MIDSDKQIIVQEYVVKETNTMADASLVFAILGCTCLPILGGTIAMIVGFIALLNPFKRSQTIISLLIGFLSIAGLVAIWIIVFAVGFGRI